MIITQQQSLFTPSLPEWQNVTIEWLFEYITCLYPEMKFKCFETYNFDGEKSITIKQAAFKKIQLDFGIGEYDKCVDWCKNRNYVFCHTGQEFGNWSGSGETWDCMEEFLEFLPLRVEQCKNCFAKYKEYRRNIKEEENAG